MSCLDDDVQPTRLTTCKVLRQLLALKSTDFTSKKYTHHNLFLMVARIVDRLHSIYSDLLKRLDDSSDEVRLAMTKTLQEYFRYANITLLSFLL